MKFRRFKTLFDSIFLSDIVSTADVIANMLCESGIEEISQDVVLYKKEFRQRIGETVDVEYRGEITYKISEKKSSGFALTIQFNAKDGRRNESAKILYSIL